MKTIDIGEASSTLAEYLKQARTEPLVFTDHGTPTAVILTLVNTDMETAALSTNPEFIALIERSRARAKAEGGFSAAEMRRRVLPTT
jgi:prevent-host-death family protein